MTNPAPSIPVSSVGIQKDLVHQAGRARWSFLLSVLASFSGGLTVVAQARLVSLIVAGVFLDKQTFAGVANLLVVLLGVIGLRAGMVFLGETAARRTARTVKGELQADLFTHLLALGPAYTRANRAGELATTLTAGIEALDAYFSQYLPQLALAVLIPLTILFAIFPLDTLSGAVLLLTAPLIPLFMILIGGHSEALTRKQWGELSRLGSYFLDTLQGLTTLKILGQSQARAESIADASQAYRRRTLAVLRVTFLSALVLELVATISTAVVAVEIGLRLLAGGIDYRQALYILILAPEFYLPLRSLGMRFHAGTSGVSAARRIFEILAQPISISTPNIQGGAINRSEGGSVRANVPQALRFENVSYTYPGSEKPALADLSFTLSPGQRIALVGASGAGKSTLLQLLLYFIVPTSGRIGLGEGDLNALPPAEWRRRVAWVPQAPYLFNDSLAVNLCLGRPEATRTEMEAALAWAHLDGFVASVPQGLETKIGEGGARLSGGQAQRLTLARAYLKDSPYLFMDEPGTSLDPEQEAFMTGALARLSRDRSVVTIAHRLWTARAADRILVLRAGRLVESGTHAALIDQQGVYMRLLSSNGGWPGENSQ